MNLRLYQSGCHDAILEKWHSHQSTLAVLATGTGKTIIFAHVIKSMQPKRALVLAHREELIWQARDKIEQATGIPVEIEMADLSARTSLFHRTPVVVATVQTMISGKSLKRMGRFKPEDFGVVIIDEAHHATSKSYRQIIDYFKQNPELKILGVTATPDRADKEALGQIFESVAFEYEILDGIEDGWLVDVTQQFFQVKTMDFSEVRTTAGDLNGADLAAVMEAEKNIAGVCHPVLEVAYALNPKTLSTIPVNQWTEYLTSLRRTARRSIVFTASVAQAEACCNILNRAVPKVAEWVCGKTPKDDRRDLLKRFSTGQTNIVVNCGVLTEGFDNPAVEVIFMARPTKSRSLYCQMVGRSTRPLPGIVDSLPTADERKNAIKASSKPWCRIIDFVGNSGRHKLITCFDILGGKISEQAATNSILKTIETGKAVRVCRTLTNEEQRLEEQKRELQEKIRLQEEARKQRLLFRSEFTHRDVSPFERGSTAPEPEFYKWSRKPISEKQRRVLTQRGYNPDRMSPQQARVLIGVIAGREHWGKKGNNGQNQKPVESVSTDGGQPF